MEWIAIAIVFCFLMSKWPRKTLKYFGFCVVVTIVISAIIVGIIKYPDYKNDKIKQNIKIDVKYDTIRCSDKEYPLALTIKNFSDTKVYKVEFTIHAYAKGRSTNLVDYGGRYACDRIIAPDEEVRACFPTLKLKEDHNPSNIDWHASVTGIETSMYH